MEQELPVDQALEKLPPEQRAQRYRKFAKDALRKAQKTSDPGRRAEYFSMASSWHAIASEMERLARAFIPSGPASCEEQRAG